MEVENITQLNDNFLSDLSICPSIEQGGPFYTETDYKKIIEFIKNGNIHFDTVPNDPLIICKSIGQLMPIILGKLNLNL